MTWWQQQIWLIRLFQEPTQKVVLFASIWWSLTVPPFGSENVGEEVCFLLFFNIPIWYCSTLSLEGQKDGRDDVAARHLEGEIPNVISVRWHKNSFHVVSDQKPSGGEAAVGRVGGGDGWGDRETRGWGGRDLCREAHHTKRIYLGNVWVKCEKLLFACKKTCWFEMNQRSQCKIVKWQRRWRFTKPFVSLQRELGKYCIWKKKKPITSNEINPTALLGVIHTLMSVYNWLIVTLPLS